MEQIERQGGSKDDAVDRWAKQEAERWVKEQFGATKLVANEGSEEDPSGPARPSPYSMQASNRPPANALKALPKGEEDQVAMLTLNAYTARRELVKMKQELARLKSQGHSSDALVEDAIRLRNQAQAQVTRANATDQSETPGETRRDSVRQKQMERELAKVREEAMREASQKERRALERAEQQIRSLMEERNEDQASRTSERVKAERTQREDAARLAKERAEERAHELALRKQELARYKAEMREAAERRNHQDVEEKVRERARRLAREEAERRARDHISHRTAEIREMRERKAREEAEKKVVLERQAREEAEKKAKVKMNRMAREEAKRKKKDLDEKKARDLFVQRQFEAEQQRFQMEEHRKLEALKALEDKQKRQQEKLERKERKLRDQAEKQALLERQARKEMEQKLALLEENHNAEVTKRKELEAAYKREVRQQEEAARQLAMTTRANADLEKQLFTLTSSLGGSGGKGATEAAGDLSVHMTPQQKRHSASPTRRLHPTPTTRSPTDAESDSDAVLPEAELLRSSYYVRHLKDLASRELLREAGIQPDAGSALAARLAGVDPVRSPTLAADPVRSPTLAPDAIAGVSGEQVQEQTENNVAKTVNEALVDMEASIQRAEAAASSLSDGATSHATPMNQLSAAARAAAAAYRMELQQELAILRELVHQVELGHGDLTMPLTTRQQRLDVLQREMCKSSEMVEKVKAEEAAAATLAVASPEAVELANNEAQVLEQVRGKIAELESFVSIAAVPVAQGFVPATLEPAALSPNQLGVEAQTRYQAEPESTPDQGAASEPGRVQAELDTQAYREMDEVDSDREGLAVQEKLQRLFSLREELLKSSAYVSHLKKVATRELRDVVHRRQAKGNGAVDAKLEAAVREAAAARDVLSCREAAGTGASTHTLTPSSPQPHLTGTELPQQPLHETIAAEVVDDVLSGVIVDMFGADLEEELRSNSQREADAASAPRPTGRVHSKPRQRVAGADGIASKGRRVASTGAAGRDSRRRGGARSLSPSKMMTRYGQPRSNRYRSDGGNSRLNASSHQRRHGSGGGGRALPMGRGGGDARRRRRGGGSASGLPRSLEFTAPFDPTSGGRGTDVRRETAGPGEFVDLSSPYTQSNGRCGDGGAMGGSRAHRNRGASPGRRREGTRARRDGGRRAMMDSSASWGSFGGPGDGSPGLRETAKALGLPLPTDGPDGTGEDPRDGHATAVADSPQVAGWVDGAESGGGLAATGSDSPPQNWRAEQEAGWAASLPQQSEKDRALAEAYLPPSLLHAYRAKPVPKANRRYG